MTKKILCTSKQQIFVFDKNKKISLSSEFIDQYCSNQKQIINKHAWKTTGFGAMFRNDMQSMTTDNIEQIYNTGSITGIAPIDSDKILFSVMIGDSSGIFTKSITDLKNDHEGHILHDKGKIFQDIAINSKDEVLISIRNMSSEQNIAISNLGSPHFKELTEGDSQDRNPFWHPDYPEIFVYDSAPIGFMQNGAPVIGPRTIMKMDLETNEIDDIIEDYRYDFMNPQIDQEGNVWCIRRPYKTRKKQTSPFDILFMPLKLGKAIFSSLSTFTERNTGEPLITSGANPTKMKQASEELFFEGKKLEAQLNLEKNSKSGDNFPGYIPRSWELIRVTQDLEITVHAKSVCSFTLVSKDEFLYSNGKFLFSSKNGKTEKIGEVHLPTKILAI